MNVPLVDLKSLHSGAIDAAIQDVINSAWFILGEKVESFENDFAKFCDAKFCIAVSSGSAALHLALLACGIGFGSEVITAPNSFIATAEAVAHVRAIPIFADVDPQTYTINPNEVDQVITPRTRAIIPVHLYGQPTDMDAISAIANTHNLVVIEDACQAHGSQYKGRQVGTFGSAGCFSFYPAKNLGGYGDGGAVVTNDKAVADTVRMLRDHGSVRKNYYKYVGFNYRMDAFQGAVLGAKLPCLNSWNEQRRRNAQLYTALLESREDISTPVEAVYARHVYHQYVVQVKRRDLVYNRLEEAGIHAGIHYPLPIHLQDSFAYLGYHAGDFPVSEVCANEVLSLPIHPVLAEDDIRYVVCTLKAILEGIS